MRPQRFPQRRKAIAIAAHSHVGSTATGFQEEAFIGTGDERKAFLLSGLGDARVSRRESLIPAWLEEVKEVQH